MQIESCCPLLRSKMQAGSVARFCEAKCKRVLLPAFAKQNASGSCYPLLSSKMQAGPVARFCEANPRTGDFADPGIIFYFPVTNAPSISSL